MGVNSEQVTQISWFHFDDFTIGCWIFYNLPHSARLCWNAWVTHIYHLDTHEAHWKFEENNWESYDKILSPLISALLDSLIFKFLNPKASNFIINTSFLQRVLRFFTHTSLESRPAGGRGINRTVLFPIARCLPRLRRFPAGLSYTPEPNNPTLNL